MTSRELERWRPVGIAPETRDRGPARRDLASSQADEIASFARLGVEVAAARARGDVDAYRASFAEMLSHPVAESMAGLNWESCGTSAAASPGC
jgi:hypothetical protein